MRLSEREKEFYKKTYNFGEFSSKNLYLRNFTLPCKSLFGFC